MKFRKYLSLSVIAVLLICVTGCTKSADMVGKLNTETSSAAQEETESISTEELLQNDTVETGQTTTQELAGTAGVSSEQITVPEATAESETVPEEPTEPSDEVVTEPVTEPAIENIIPTQKETTGPKATESVTAAPTQSTTQKATAAQPVTQKPTEAVTQAPTKPATQKPMEAPTQKPTEVQTTAPAPTEEETTVNAAIAERDAWFEEWYDEAYVYPWDFEYIEAELRAYGESLGMTYETEEYVESLWYDNPQVQQWWTLEEWMADGLLTPDNANWNVPMYLIYDENKYSSANGRENLFNGIKGLADRGTTVFRIYFELDETGKSCCIYTLY